MRRLLCIFIGCFCLAFPLLAQSNKLIKELESKRGALQKQITESETLLKTTKKTVSSQLNGLAALTGQIEERKRYILTINNDVIDLCEAGVETNPEMLEFYFYLAIAYNQAERTDDVISICQKALTQITADSKKEVVSDFYSILGDAYHTKDLNTEAYAAYDSALVYNPSNIGALNNYAYYLSVERRNLDKAEEMSYKTVKAEPDNATYLDTYAWILFEKGNYAEARLYIDNAMKSDGGKSDVIVEHCGDIYYMTGDVDKALEYWNQALKIGSKSKTLQEKIRKKKYISDK